MTDSVSIVRAYWDRVFVEGDLDALDDLVTDPSVRHNVDGTKSFTRSQLKQLLGEVLDGFRAERVDFDQVTADGSTVWLRATLRGMSMAAMTPLTIVWLSQYRLEGDRIAETWSLHQTNLDWRP